MFLIVPSIQPVTKSAKDGTIKYLWQLSDGNCVETVLMRYHYGNTVCISTEVGCRMGCAFCASTLGGLVRRLEPFEMLDQVLFTQVDRLMWRMEMFMPSGLFTSSRNRSTLSKLSRGSPMPIRTIWDTGRPESIWVKRT